MIVGRSIVNVWDHGCGIRPSELWIPVQPFLTCVTLDSLIVLRVGVHLYKSSVLESCGKQITEWKGKDEKYQASQINEIRAALGILVAERTVSSGCCHCSDTAPAMCVPHVTRNCQESNSQSRPSVWPSLGLLPGAGDSLPGLLALGEDRYPKKHWGGIEA